MGAAETALGNYERPLEYLLAARKDMDQPAIMFAWYGRMQLESPLTELWLAKGDLAQARPQAERFLKTALATAEHTWQALAWADAPHRSTPRPFRAIPAREPFMHEGYPLSFLGAGDSVNGATYHVSPPYTTSGMVRVVSM